MFKTLIASILTLAATGIALAGDDEQEIRKEVEVWVENGKVTITTDGETRELDLKDAMEDGEVGKMIKVVATADGDVGDKEANVEVTSRVMMVDDEGNVINLGGGHHDHDVMILTDGDGEHGTKKKIIKRKLKLPGGAPMQFQFKADGDIDLEQLGNHFSWIQRDGHGPGAMFFSDEDAVYEFIKQSDYMIGIELQPISDMLRAHVDLDEGVGIGVGGVLDDSPAASAGLETHDIIVSAGGEAITGFKALVEAVEAAGEAHETLALVIIRHGDHQELDVTPAKRDHDGEGHHEGGEHEDDDDGESEESIRKEIKELQRALDALRSELGDRD